MDFGTHQTKICVEEKDREVPHDTDVGLNGIAHRPVRQKKHEGRDRNAQKNELRSDPSVQDQPQKKEKNNHKTPRMDPPNSDDSSKISIIYC